MSAISRRPSASLDTRVIYCGDNLDQLRKLPDGCAFVILSEVEGSRAISPSTPPLEESAIDPPFNSNRNCEVFWGETKEKRRFEDRQVLSCRGQPSGRKAWKGTFALSV